MSALSCDAKPVHREAREKELALTTPHTVSLINTHSGRRYPVILRGVMLQAMNGRSVQRRGEYTRCPDPEKHWTLQPEGESAGRCSFFVKGEIPEACTLAEAREKYDFVYIVAGWQLHDYGSRSMQHYEVVSKVSSRYYRYN